MSDLTKRRARRRLLREHQEQQEQQRREEYMAKPIFIYKLTKSEFGKADSFDADDFYQKISAKLVHGQASHAYNRNITIRYHPHSKSTFVDKVFITRNDNESTVEEKPIQTCSTIILNPNEKNNTILELDDEIIFIQGWSISLIFSKLNAMPDDLIRIVREQANAEIHAADVAARAASSDDENAEIHAAEVAAKAASGDDDDEEPQFAPTFRIRLT